VNGRFVKPLDTEALMEIAERFDRVVTVEENTLNGGFGSAVLDYLDSIGYGGRILRLGIPDRFIQHGERKLLLREVGLDEDGIYRSVSGIIKSKRSLLRVFQLRRNGKRPEPEEKRSSENAKAEPISAKRPDDE
jgi:deoxyxylulose-5-phosphate synthase